MCLRTCTVWLYAATLHRLYLDETSRPYRTVCSNWTHAALSSLKNFMLYLHMCIVSVLFFPIALLSCLYLFLENFHFFGHEKVVKTDNTSYSQSIFSTHLFFGLHGITFLVVWFFCLHSIVNGLNPNYAFVFDRKRFTLRRSGFCLAMVLLVSCVPIDFIVSKLFCMELKLTSCRHQSRTDHILRITMHACMQSIFYSKNLRFVILIFYKIDLYKP